MNSRFIFFMRLIKGQVNKAYIVISLLSLILLAFNATAKESTKINRKYEFNIPVQSLSESLNKLSDIAKISFLFPYNLVENKEGKSVQGKYTVQQALTMLLKSTNLEGVLSGKRAFLIKPLTTNKNYNNNFGEKQMKSQKTLLATIFTLIFSSTGNAEEAQAPLSASAQEENKQNVKGLEVIEVTAQFRTQNIQTVPIAISSLGVDELEKADIHDATGIAKFVPGMTYAEFAPGQANISMRGINTTDDSAALDNSVALFLDGVYIGRGASINFDMFDMERIEVLRGPQGTLFGRNAIGGAISVITAKPTDDFRAKVGVTVGNEGILQYQGLVNGSLTDNLFGKFSVAHKEHDGFVRNVVQNIDMADQDTTSFRGQLMYQGSGSEWLLSADHMEDDRADMGRVAVGNRSSADYVGFVKALGADGDFESASPVDGYSTREANGVSLTGTIDFDNGKFVTITALRHAETDWNMGSVGAPFIGGAPWWLQHDLGDPSTQQDDIYGTDVIDDIVEDIDTFSQEFRWVSTLDGPFNFTTGVFLFSEETDRKEQFKVASNTFATPQQLVGNSTSTAHNETTSYAIYGQGYYAFNEQWDITFGLRYTEDEKTYSNTGVTCSDATSFASSPDCAGSSHQHGGVNVIGSSFTAATKDSWDDVSPMANLKYQANENLMFYTSVAKGFKSGGFAGSPGSAAVAVAPVKPEIAINYELGFKGDFIENTLRFNTTLFYTDFQDLQVTRFGPTPGTPFGTFQTKNAGSADIQGIEVEFNWNITDNFNVSGNYAYLDTEVSDLFLDTNVGSVGAAGNSLRQAPENSYQLTANYFVPIEEGELDLRLDYSYIGEQHMSLTQTNVVIEETSLLNGRISWVSPDETINVSLWVKNITDEADIVHVYTLGPAIVGVWGEPRTFGISATYTFE